MVFSRILPTGDRNVEKRAKWSCSHRSLVVGFTKHFNDSKIIESQRAKYLTYFGARSIASHDLWREYQYDIIYMASRAFYA